MRRQDSNLRPPGYEPDKLPAALLRDLGSKVCGARGRTRTGTNVSSTDFKSVASASSATRAKLHAFECLTILAEHCPGVKEADLQVTGARRAKLVRIF